MSGKSTLLAFALAVGAIALSGSDAFAFASGSGLGASRHWPALGGYRFGPLKLVKLPPQRGTTETASRLL